MHEKDLGDVMGEAAAAPARGNFLCIATLLLITLCTEDPAGAGVIL